MVNFQCYMMCVCVFVVSSTNIIFQRRNFYSLSLLSLYLSLSFSLSVCRFFLSIVCVFRQVNVLFRFGFPFQLFDCYSTFHCFLLAYVLPDFLFLFTPITTQPTNGGRYFCLTHILLFFLTPPSHMVRFDLWIIFFVVRF